VVSIDLAQGRAYLRFEGDGSFPADEYEKVDPPAPGHAHVEPAFYPGARALMRDPKALAERLARESS
jgi:hypothetical protein